MPLLTVLDVSLAYGHHPLLDHASFTLERGDRACIIGRNGTGKSTLLKLVAGLAVADQGEVRRDSGVRVAYLHQEPNLDERSTVFECVAEGLGELRQLVLDYHAVVHALNAPDADMAPLLERLHVLQEALEQRHGWEAQRRIEQTLSLLQLPPDTPVSELSGGWKRRVALGRALAVEPDILLLDEPTNHLDIEAIQWLEDTLVAFRGALLFVTHDRHFLDRLATRILELDRGRLTEFPGNYESYQRRKAELLAAEATATALFDKHLAEEERWIRKGIQARRTRNEGRVRALKALRAEHAERRNLTGKARLALDRGEQSGKLVLETEHLRFDYPGRPVVRDLSLRVMRGDRIGLIGPNGVGKTTLLKLLLGQLSPQSGSVKHGTKLQVAYFDQTRARLDPEARVVDCVGGGKESVTIGGKTRHVMSYLADFLFPPERARSPVKSLSGGERARLLLAQLFSQPANVLVMDEPTNDLDIETLELLEELLTDYEGTLFLVSHDRAFLDNVVTSCLVFSGDGDVEEYVGGYSDWLRQRRVPGSAPRRAPPASGAPEAAPPAVATAPAAPKPAGGRKLSYKEQRELAELPARIERLEQEQLNLQQQLSDPALYSGSPQKAQDLGARLQALATELAAAYARWEMLESG
jgi:ATP-binding cassette subfamily F protein uup